MCSLTKILFLFCALFYLVSAAVFTTVNNPAPVTSSSTSHALNTDDGNVLVSIAAKKRCAICIDKMNVCHSKGNKSWEFCRAETCGSMGTRCNFCKGITCPAPPKLARVDTLQTNNDNGSKVTTTSPSSPATPPEKRDSTAICNRVCSIWLTDCAKIARDPVEQAACYGRVCKQKNCDKCFSYTPKAQAGSFWGK